MLDEYNNSKPQLTMGGMWHIPFGDNIDISELNNIIREKEGKHIDSEQLHKFQMEYVLKIATARCARVSYNDFEGKKDHIKDIKLHDALAASGHWSPLRIK